jgi:hypothetical protein
LMQVVSSTYIKSVDMKFWQVWYRTTCSKSDERINVDASWENQTWFSSNLLKVGDVA